MCRRYFASQSLVAVPAANANFTLYVRSMKRMSGSRGSLHRYSSDDVMALSGHRNRWRQERAIGKPFRCAIGQPCRMRRCSARSAPSASAILADRRRPAVAVSRPTYAVQLSC